MLCWAGKLAEMGGMRLPWRCYVLKRGEVQRRILRRNIGNIGGRIGPAPHLGEEFAHIHSLGLHLHHPGVFQHSPGRRPP